MAAPRRLRPVPSQRLPGAMVSGAPAVLSPAGHIDLGPHGQTRPGYRSSRSRTATNRHDVLGSNNFRSPNRCAQSRLGKQAGSCADRLVLYARGSAGGRSSSRQNRVLGRHISSVGVVGLDSRCPCQVQRVASASLSRRTRCPLGACMTVQVPAFSKAPGSEPGRALLLSRSPARTGPVVTRPRHRPRPSGRSS
jgi:hypothetical protein